MIESADDWMKIFDAYILPIQNHGPLNDSKITFLSGMVTGLHIFIAPESEAGNKAQEYLKSLAEVKAGNFKADLENVMKFNGHIKQIQLNWIKKTSAIQPENSDNSNDSEMTL